MKTTKHKPPYSTDRLVFRVPTEVIGRSRVKSLFWPSGSQILQLETLGVPIAACRKKYGVSALIACLKEEREKHAGEKRSCTDKMLKKVARSNARGGMQSSVNDHIWTESLGYFMSSRGEGGTGSWKSCCCLWEGFQVLWWPVMLLWLGIVSEWLPQLLLGHAAAVLKYSCPYRSRSP